MKKMFLLGLLLMTSISHASGLSGSEGVGGGGGVKRNGSYMTFYSAGLYVQPVNTADESSVQVPAIDDLFDFISNLKFLSADTKLKFLDAITQTTRRKYELATPSQLTPEIYNRLLAEFKRVTGVETSDLELFAITDVPQKTTYLLPNFLELSHNDQMAILFHEAYWIVFPNATYNEIVSAEMAFEAVLKNPKDFAAIYDFTTKIKADNVEVVEALLKWDASQGNLKGFIDQNGQVTLEQFTGSEFFKCAADAKAANKTPQCAIYLRTHLNTLSRKYPRSMTLRQIIKTYDLSRFYREDVIEASPYKASNYLALSQWIQYIGEEKVQSCKVNLTSLAPAVCERGWRKGSTYIKIKFY